MKGRRERGGGGGGGGGGEERGGREGRERAVYAAETRVGENGQ